MPSDPDRSLAIQINLAEREIRERFEEIVDYLRSRNRLDDLEDAISRGDYEGAIREIDRGAIMLSEATGLAYLSAGQATSSVIQGMVGRGASVTFDVTNDRAVQWLRNNRFDTIRGFTQSQIEAVRGAVLIGQQTGINPRDQARIFRQSIGLTDYQNQVVENYRRALTVGDVGNALSRELRDARNDPRIRRMVADPLTSKEIDQRVEAYRQSWINFRAETIARTEALRAVHAGADEAWDQAVEDGDVDFRDIECEWHISPGQTRRGKRRTRDSHWAMRNQVQPFGQPFISGHGNLLRYPCDPEAPVKETANCRCRKVTRLINRAA